MEGSLSRKVKETIAVLVSKDNSCSYCVAAHTGALRAIGVTDEELKSIEEDLDQADFSGKEKASKLAPLIVELRSLATVQPGYITGKTFRCLDCPGEYIVISTWNSLDDWNNWLQSKQRMALQKQVDDLLGEVTQYRIYEPLVGGIIPQFHAGAE